MWEKNWKEGYKSREASRTASRYVVEANSVPANSGARIKEFISRESTRERTRTACTQVRRMIPEDIFFLSLSLSLFFSRSARSSSTENRRVPRLVSQLAMPHETMQQTLHLLALARPILRAAEGELIRLVALQTPLIPFRGDPPPRRREPLAESARRNSVARVTAVRYFRLRSSTAIHRAAIACSRAFRRGDV